MSNENRESSCSYVPVYDKTIDLIYDGYYVTFHHDKYRRLEEVSLHRGDTFIKTIVGNGTTLIDYPNDPENPPYVKYSDIYLGKMFENGVFCFGYVEKVIQGSADEDGFGMQPDERIVAYALMNNKGEYLTKFSNKVPEGYYAVRRP